MKTVNMIGKCQGWNYLVQMISTGLSFEQTKEVMHKLGYYVPEDQFNAVNAAIDIQIDLQIGKRQYEAMEII